MVEDGEPKGPIWVEGNPYAMAGFPAPDPTKNLTHHGFKAMRRKMAATLEESATSATSSVSAETEAAGAAGGRDSGLGGEAAGVRPGTPNGSGYLFPEEVNPLINARMLEVAAGAMRAAGEKVSEMLSQEQWTMDPGTMDKGQDIVKSFEDQVGFITNLLEPEFGRRGCLYRDDTVMTDASGINNVVGGDTTAVDPSLTMEERHQLAMAQATVLERDLVAELERRRQDSATITRLISEMDRINEMAGQAVRDPASTTNTGLVNILAEIDQVQSNSASIMERIDADDREAEARMGINWDSNLPLPSYEDLYGEPDK